METVLCSYIRYCYKTRVLMMVHLSSSWISARLKFALTPRLEAHVQLIDWLIIYGFTSRIYMETSPLPVSKGCFRPMLGAQDLWAGRNIYQVPHLLWNEASVFPVSFEGCLLRHTRGCGGSILTRILTGTCTNGEQQWWSPGNNDLTTRINYFL
jgi:hypothetical protein